MSSIVTILFLDRRLPLFYTPTGSFCAEHNKGRASVLSEKYPSIYQQGDPSAMQIQIVQVTAET
jgi:hypothetical protein